jgi:biotin carboxylase
MAEPGAPLTVLCLATFEKGAPFMRACHELGCRVLLVTLDKLKDAPSWPRDVLAETFYLPETLSRDDLLKGVSHVARSHAIDRIVALDDFDVETAALLREHLRVPGMGETTARYFRDKLAMRFRAQTAGIPVPAFVSLFNDTAVAAYAERVPPPWFVKPRSQAASLGIRKAASTAALWEVVHGLGDERSFYLLEQFVQGDVYHVDSIVADREVVFSAVHRYGAPPWTVAHEGGVFTTQTVAANDPAGAALTGLNCEVLAALGLARGVAHTEFIHDAAADRFVFLETSARVGGAFIVDVVEASTGLNLWREWARVEIAGEAGGYQLPAHASRAAGLVLSLANQEHPDLSSYDAPEVVRRLDKPHHAGLIVAGDDPGRIHELVVSYADRVRREFTAFAPAPPRAMH